MSGRFTLKLHLILVSGEHSAVVDTLKLHLILVSGEHSAVVDGCHSDHLLHATLQGAHVSNARLFCHSCDTLTIINTVFDGKIKTIDVWCVGGFICRSGGDSYIDLVNCLFAGC